MLVIGLSSNEGSGEPAQMLTYTKNVYVVENHRPKFRPLVLLDISSLHVRLNEAFVPMQ